MNSAPSSGTTQGKGASRRLRHLGKVPAILYGGHREPRGLSLDHQKLLALLDDERFYSTILNVHVGDQTQAVILKDVQRHPARNAVLHVDLQRVLESEKIRIRIPLHFHGESIAPGVKEQGGIVSHQKTEVDVSCLPNDLPEFIEVDVSQLALNQSLHLSDLKIPQGVQLIELAHGRDSTVVSVHMPRAEEPEPTAVAAAVEGVPVEGAAAAPGPGAAPGAPGAAPAEGAAAAAGKKGEETKKDEGKKEEAKKEPERKRQEVRRARLACLTCGPPSGGPLISRVSDRFFSYGFVSRFGSSSVSAIPGRSTRSRATTPASGSPMRSRVSTTGSFVRSAASRASSRRFASASARSRSSSRSPS